MFDSTLKRSAATLSVVAGLLAAAGPANAQILEGPLMAKPGPQPAALMSDGRDLAPKKSASNPVLDTGMFDHEWLKAPAGGKSGANPFFGGLGNDTLDSGAGADAASGAGGDRHTRSGGEVVPGDYFSPSSAEQASGFIYLQ
jgi:hypothetical protein